MKNIFLIVAFLLIGTNTEAKISANNNPIEVISFIQDNILYKISTTGTLSFEVLPDNNYPNNIISKKEKRKERKKKNKVKLPKIDKDIHGNVIKIGETNIRYKKNGKVKQIGSIALVYNRGWLTQIGGFDIFYNSSKRIYDIEGNIVKSNIPTFVNGKVWNKTQWNGYGSTITSI